MNFIVSVLSLASRLVFLRFSLSSTFVCLVVFWKKEIDGDLAMKMSDHWDTLEHTWCVTAILNLRILYDSDFSKLLAVESNIFVWIFELGISWEQRYGSLTITCWVVMFCFKARVVRLCDYPNDIFKSFAALLLGFRKCLWPWRAFEVWYLLAYLGTDFVFQWRPRACQIVSFVHTWHVHGILWRLVEVHKILL